MTPRPPLDPQQVSCWIFDLDNTLYPAASNLFARVAVRMTAYIAAEYGLTEADALALQKRMFRRHGTTLRGLMLEHGQDPHRFLDYVHDIDVADMAADPALDRLIARLPGRKLVYTNGTVAHAGRIMRQLGIARHFEAVFDIAAGDFIPKPDPRPYAKLVERFAVTPASSVMIEDIAKNLRPAAGLGMTTVWLRHARDWAAEGAGEPHIHHVADDLKGWLATILDRPAGP